MSDGTTTHDEHAHEHHIVSVWAYAGVLLALAILMGLTVGAAFIDLGPLNIYIAVGLAVCKTTFIVMIFMNVYYSTKLTKIFVVTGFFFLLILFGLIIIDFVSRTVVTSTQPWG